VCIDDINHTEFYDMNTFSRILLKLLNRTDEAVANGAGKRFDYAASWNPKGQRCYGVSMHRTDQHRSVVIDMWAYTFCVDIAATPSVAAARQGNDVSMDAT
jgi:hypothetical protein